MDPLTELVRVLTLGVIMLLFVLVVLLIVTATAEHVIRYFVSWKEDHDDDEEDIAVGGTLRAVASPGEGPDEDGRREDSLRRRR